MMPLDYIVIVFYFLFVLALGFVYKYFSRTASDYFRGGGGMIWPMVGISTFVMQFTAWSFTGGAGKAYETGVFFLILFGCNLLGTLLTVLVTAPLYRQMRVITGVEAIRNRFGPANEQFFTWLPVPFFVIFGGIGLYAISVFMAAVFDIDVMLVILAIGVTVTVMSILGGSWAVAASNFLQLLTVLTVVIVMVWFSLRHPQVGGLSGLLSQLPADHLNPASTVRLSVLIPFVLTLALTQIIGMNSMQQGAAGYVFVKNGKDARKAAIVCLLGGMILPLLWSIPAFASVLVFPELEQMYPQLKNPSEAAYAAMALEVLPKGLAGLLICAIFAATMSSMDAGLNRSAGIIVRNFYLPIINPEATESRQILWGKVTTGIFGALMILTGTFFSTLQSMPLFDLILIASAAVGIPVAVPLFLGMFIRRTPPWAGWSTALFGFAVSLALQAWMTPDRLGAFFEFSPVLSGREFGELRIAMTNGVLAFATILWFLGTIPFYKRSSEEYKREVKGFFRTMHAPIDMGTEHIASYDNDRRQYRVLGLACVAYGSVLMLFSLGTDSASGVWGFLFCGGLITGVGLVFWGVSRHLKPAPWELPNEEVEGEQIP